MPNQPPVCLSLLALLFLLGCGLGSTAAESLPDAAAVSTRLGQEVEFADVIKAISKSRSKPGCYFSFGAPYPKQILSVWVPDEVYFQLPRDPGLLGRRVRVKGRLKSSPTGPIVTLASPAEFGLLDVNESILAKDFLDGRMDREHFMAALGQAFWREDFALLEELIKELRQSHERFTDGTWIMSVFFRALEVDEDESDDRYREVGEKLARWRAGYPGSAAALIVQAGFHLDLGWHARGAGSGSEMPAGVAEYSREAGVARQILEANPAAKILPEYFVKMEIVAFAEAWTREAFFRLFDEAIAREPDYYMIYFQAARYLAAGPRAERGAWERFAAEQRKKRGAGGEGDALYARIAWSISVRYHDFFRDSSVSWETMAAGFDRLIRQYPDSLWLKNAYANFAFRARDRTRLRPALAAVAAHPDMGIWVNLENVALAQKFAAQEPENGQRP